MERGRLLGVLWPIRRGTGRDSSAELRLWPRRQWGGNVDLRGWRPDPFGVHEERLFDNGKPTPLVRDDGIGSYDEPPEPLSLGPNATPREDSLREHVASEAPLGTDHALLPPAAGHQKGRFRRVRRVARQWPPPRPTAPRTVRLFSTSRRAWMVPGSAIVLLGSIVFVATQGSAPERLALHAKSDTATGIAVTRNGAPSSSVPLGSRLSGSTSNGVAQGVPLGVYAGEANPFGVATFGLKTGTIPSYATDYLDKSGGWAAMDSASNIKAWSGTRYRLSIGVPILPGVGTLAQGATGVYDQYFATLGENLVSDHEADAILRLGWEFNGNWFRWSVASPTDAADFVAFWRQIVTTMRTVPGEKFKFLWNPNGPSPTSYTPEQAYPGDSYVDYVGTDLYDNFWGTPFTPVAGWVNQLSQQWGLDWLATFAAEHNKPIAIPEWSDEYRTDGHGFGDDPSFVDNMAQWFVTNDVAFASILSYDSSPTYRNDILDGTFPHALAQFRKDFG